MTQFTWQYVLDKFRANGNVLRTMDFISDIHTAAEYRRVLCDLKAKGFPIVSEKVTPKSWRYILIEKPQWPTEPNGQELLIAEEAA